MQVWWVALAHGVLALLVSSVDAAPVVAGAGAPVQAPAPASVAALTDAAKAASPRRPWASSADGRFILLALAEPPCLVVLGAAKGLPVRLLKPASRTGQMALRVAAIRTAPLRRSFIVAPADVAELWEISYDVHVEDIYDGLVHDYRFGEGVPRPGYLGLRRTALPEPLVDFVVEPEEAEAWGLAQRPPAGSGQGQVINLDVRRRVAVMPEAEMQRRMQALARLPVLLPDWARPALDGSADLSVACQKLN